MALEDAATTLSTLWEGEVHDDELEDDCGPVFDGDLFGVFLSFGTAGVILANSAGSTIVASAIVTLRTEYRWSRSVLDLNLNYCSK